jgi:NAD-dependent deacetylase
MPIPSSVMELHGTIRRNRCHNPAHGIIHAEPEPGSGPGDEQQQQEQHFAATPTEELRRLRCPTCGGMPRPDFVLFTEPLPASEWIKAERALGALQPERGDVLLVVGTTGAVYPAASLPERCIRRGVRTIEINMDRSPISDAVDVFLQGKAAEVLPALVERLMGKGGDKRD